MLQEERPLFTPARAAALAAAWDSGCREGKGIGRGQLPASAAHRAMFSAEERSEYTLEYFLDDLVAFGPAVPDELSLEEAAAFLKANQ